MPPLDAAEFARHLSTTLSAKKGHVCELRRRLSLYYVGTQRRDESGVPRLSEWIPGDGVGSAAVIDVGGGGAV